MLYSKKTAFVSIAAGISLAAAQSLSSQCQSTLASIVISNEAQCLNAQALVGIFLAGSGTSLVQPINNWLTGMCSQSACTNATLAAVVSNVTSGCPTELSEMGLGNVSAGQLTTLVEMAYPTVRQIACLENSSTNTLCITETLTNYQNATGTTLTSTEVENLATQIVAGNSSSIPSSVTCTDCNKQSYNILKSNFPDFVSSSTQSSISNTCGASFVDGSNPSNVRQTASNSTSSSTSTSGDASTLGQVMGPISSSALAAILFAFIV